jgi:ParB family chromosome partitioning protein
MALGKGLGALIQEKEKALSIIELDIDAIVPNEQQPRKAIDNDSLQGLASSIREKGVIQPIIVRRTSEGSYSLIAGERRWRAAKIAGLKKIPAIIKDAARAESLELALIENIQREDLNPIETAEAFQRLIEEFKLTHDELSKKVGKDRATVTNYLRLLKLQPEIKKWIAEGSLSIGHAKALLQIEEPTLRLEAAKKIVKRALSVREAEALAKKISSDSGKKTYKWKDPEIASLEENLKQSLGTKVQLIHKGKKGGKIIIEYYSLDELDRLLEILMP